MALYGRAGQRFSQALHPIQRSVSTRGIGVSEYPFSLGSISMAETGQWRAQLSQVTSSLYARQSSFIQWARPIWVADLSALVMRLMAPVGHTLLQRVHSGRQ